MSVDEKLYSKKKMEFWDAVERVATTVVNKAMFRQARVGLIDANVSVSVSGTFTLQPYVSGNPRVQFEGEPTLDENTTQTYPYNASAYKPFPGDRVQMIRHGGTWVINGALSGDGSVYIPTIGEVVCSLRLAASQTIENTTTGEALLWDTEEFDRGNFWTSSSAGRITPTYPGWYELNGGIGFATNTSGYRYSQIYKNGATVSSGGVVIAPSQANTVVNIRPVPIYCNGTTDYLEVYAIQSGSGSSATVITSTGSLSPSVSIKYVGR